MSPGQDGGDLYHERLIGFLELLWGEGWLSPGGAEEVNRVLQDLPLAGKNVLDIGCGVGGIDRHLVEQHGAAYVTGIDVEDTVLKTARERVAHAGLGDRIGFAKVAPGPFPFPAGTFDIVFSKDAIVHVPDKAALAREVYRVLKPGGWFAASDWLIGHDGEPSAEMKDYIAAEGLDFGMASPATYARALAGAGFENVAIHSRNAWYRTAAKEEIARLAGSIREEAESRFGADFVEHNIDIWRKMLVVLEKGEHCPTHFRARRPAAPR